MSRALALLLVIAGLGCEREERDFRPTAAQALTPEAPTQTSLFPGMAPFRTGTTARPDGYRESAWAISEGKRLFEAYNCSGCHGHGGGGMGPPLIDGKWIYGSSPEAIFATIVEGRPNGMPAFSNKIAGSELWKIVAYVRSLAPLVARDRPAARDDHMHSSRSPIVQPRLEPEAQPPRPP